LRTTGTVVSRRRWTVVDPFIASEIDLSRPGPTVCRSAESVPRYVSRMMTSTVRMRTA